MKEHWRPSDAPRTAEQDTAVVLLDTQPDAYLDTVLYQLENALMIDAVSRLRLADVGPFTVPMQDHNLTINEQFIQGIGLCIADLINDARDCSPMGEELVRDSMALYRGQEIRLLPGRVQEVRRE